LRVLFLDIDGVLNSYQSARYLHSVKHKNDEKIPEYFNDYLLKNALELCPSAVSNLEYILEEHRDLKVVVSSTWRLGCELKDLKALFPCSSLIRSRIIDSTPVLKTGQRGDEIKKWIVTQNRKVKDYVVLDDDSDMDAVEDNFVHINHKNGLTYTDAEIVIRMLSE
jgi:hypothetical protein